MDRNWGILHDPVLEKGRTLPLPLAAVQGPQLE